jgi:hypothetical protein
MENYPTKKYDKENTSLEKKIKYVLYTDTRSLHGTILHYYHFFYAMFVPLILEYVKTKNKNPDKHIVLIIDTKVGAMFRILAELPLDIRIKKMMTDYDKLIVKTKYLVVMDIHPSVTDQDTTSRDAKLIDKGYARRITKNDIQIVNNFMQDCIMNNDLVLDRSNNYDIVIIVRKVNIFYNSENYRFGKKSDIRLNGAQKRSIPNITEIFAMVKKMFPKKRIIIISLDVLPIFIQYQLFHNAELIIAQHGASLANIIFMKPHSTLIEIINRQKYNEERWFVPLTAISDVKHVEHVTEESHSVIDLNEFKSVVLKNYPRK